MAPGTEEQSTVLTFLERGQERDEVFLEQMQAAKILHGCFGGAGKYPQGCRQRETNNLRHLYILPAFICFCSMTVITIIINIITRKCTLLLYKKIVI